MAVSHRAAVDVDLFEHLFLRHAQNGPAAHQRHRGKGFVDFDHIHLVNRHIILFKNFLDGQPRHGRYVLGRLRHFRVIHDGEDGLEPQFIGLFPAHEQTDIAAIVDAGGVAGRDRARLAGDGAEMTENRGQFGEALQRRFRPRSFVFIHDEDFLALFNFHRKDLVVQFSIINRFDGVLLGIERPLVLLLPAEAELICHFGAVNGHVAVVECVPQSVVHHGVHHAAVGQTHAHSPAHVGQGEGAVAHAFLAARDADFRAPQENHLKGKVDRFDARRADFIDGDGGNGFRHTRQNRGLPAGNLAAACGNHLAHENVVHILSPDLAFRAAQDFLDGQRAQLHGRKIFQGAAGPSVRRPAGFHADHFAELPVRIADFSPHGREVGFSFAKSGDGRVFINFRFFSSQLLRCF